ncbi:MAG: hypothetical protein JWL84_4268 [Rhodospirillales bacterium]|nr:hypothetical protein [Rhodospirillales bacterium]
MLREVTITRTIDHDGERIVLVPVINSRLPAKLSACDYDRLIAAGLSPRWTFNPAAPGRCYVRAPGGKATGNLALIARLVAEVGAGQCVKYADGDRLNLRRENLLIRKDRTAKHATMQTLLAGQRRIGAPPSTAGHQSPPATSHRLTHRWKSPDRRVFQAVPKAGRL